MTKAELIAMQRTVLRELQEELARNQEELARKDAELKHFRHMLQHLEFIVSVQTSVLTRTKAAVLLTQNASVKYEPREKIDQFHTNTNE